MSFSQVELRASATPCSGSRVSGRPSARPCLRLRQAWYHLHHHSSGGGKLVLCFRVEISPRRSPTRLEVAILLPGLDTLARNYRSNVAAALPDGLHSNRCKSSGLLLATVSASAFQRCGDVDSRFPGYRSLYSTRLEPRGIPAPRHG